MSRVGKYPIAVPAGIKALIEGGVFVAQAAKGEFRFPIPDGVKISLEDSKIFVASVSKDKRDRQMWGTTRAIINNGISGLVTPFCRKVELVGVGYRASMQGSDLVLQLGYSHDINFTVPKGILVKCEKPTTISVNGSDKKMVGQVVRELQNLRKPEPYKGKGVLREGQFVIRKEGKKK
ncbi:MAG: 50S ribosomal protein L6 [Holosporales bacterium]|jgi:large subunit ribosomal protein L6|nr:50S ribosomal protein L6 [Holosporales bacterium]